MNTCSAHAVRSGIRNEAREGGANIEAWLIPLACVLTMRSPGFWNRPPSIKSLTQQLRQFGEVPRHPPRLVSRQPIWSPRWSI